MNKIFHSLVEFKIIYYIDFDRNSFFDDSKFSSNWENKMIILAAIMFLFLTLLYNSNFMEKSPHLK